MSNADWERIREALSAPFLPQSIRWLVVSTHGDKGLVVPYIDARDVMNRLDSILKIVSWADEYHVVNAPSGIAAVECALTLRYEVAGTGGAAHQVAITRRDVSTSVTGDFQAAYSAAFKRAGVKFGVGRYLYYVPKQWVPIKKEGGSKVPVSTPELPKWATPKPKGQTSDELP